MRRERSNYIRPSMPSAWARKIGAPMYSWDKETSNMRMDPQPRNNGEDISGVKRQPNIMECAVQSLREYTENASLHGIKYSTDSSNFFWERVMWFLVCCLAVTGALWMLARMFESYLESQTAISIRSTAVPIWEIPFPAVTVCNINQARRDNVMRAVKQSPWSNYSEADVFKVIHLMSEVGAVKFYEPAHDKMVEKIVNEQKEYVDDLMKSVIHPLNDMAIRCWWAGKPYNCSDLLTLRLTNQGYCWSFNSVPMKDKPSDAGASIDYLYDGVGEAPTAGSHSIDEKEFVPRVVSGAGPNMGITIMLDPELDQYFAANDFIDGFKVLIHSPWNFPDVAAKSFLVNSGKEVFVPVRPVMIDSSSDVEKTPSYKRGCSLPSEFKLRFYSTYSYANCFLECQVESMRRTCGCVPYLYANLEEAKLCDYNGTMCINRNAKKFVSIQGKSNITISSDMLDKETITVSSMTCKCKPSCDEVTYTPEATSANFPMYISDLEDMQDVNERDLVLLRVFFKDLIFVQYTRDLQFTAVRFISGFGGIVGLFVGFSLVSVAELIYFLTIRPFTRWCKSRRDTSQVTKIN